MPAISNTMLSYNNFRELFGMERVALYDEQAANVLVSRDPATGITLEYTGKSLRLYYPHRQPPPIPSITLLHSFPYSHRQPPCIPPITVLYSIAQQQQLQSATSIFDHFKKKLPLSFILEFKI